MRVISLRAENVKRLKAVEITPDPDGNVVVISGRNGQGKSSVLDSIMYALAGGRAMPEQPVREGEKRAKVVLDLGDFTVTREWKNDDTSSLTVMTKDGAKQTSPQKFLDERLGALSFDPLAFATKPAKEQRQLLLDIINSPDLDLDEMDAKRAALFDQRTEVNRRLRDTEGALAELPEIPEDTPTEEVSAEGIIAEREVYLFEQRQRLELAERIRQTEEDLEDLRHRILVKESILAELRENLPSDELEVPDITAALARIESTNALVRARHTHDLLKNDWTGMKVRVDELTASIANLDDAKQAALEAATLPIEGLAFDEEGVMYQGIPFKQCSSAEQLRVSIAMAMALNPTVRVIRVADGSLLDSTNMAVIDEMAGAHDFQMWIEVVNESGTLGFTIEDGEVVA
jgi:DNA repair exonuclease SbcCD ATPase subunit